MLPRPHKIAVILALVALPACEKGDVTDQEAKAGTSSSAVSTSASSPARPDDRGSAKELPVACSSYREGLEDRDWSIIYYATAGLEPPREKWADQALDRLDGNLGAEEAWNRAKAKVEAQWNAVKPVRCIAIRTQAAPQPYDAASGGIALGAFDPQAYFPFRDGADRISLRFRNAEQARIWKVPPDKARALAADNWFGSVDILIRARIVGARPGNDDGVIEAEVTGYDFEPSRYSRMARESVTVIP